MIRITRFPRPGGDLWKIEGDLRQGWLEEVRAALAGAEGSPRLDLADVTFADQAGISLLRELQARGAAIERCSGFLSEMLA